MTMKKQYVEGLGILEVGFNYLSSHLGWLLRTVISSTIKDTDAVASVVYNRDLPDKFWGQFFGATRSIAINLEQHLNDALGAIQDEGTMHTSIRVLLLHDLLDSCAHEAWHAKMCNDGGDWTDGNLDEEGAKKHALAMSWEIGELWDVNVETFGPLLDTLLHDLYKKLKEAVQFDDCEDWEKLQYHMLENDINYYNPDRGIEIRSIREVFAAQVQPEIPWVDTDSNLFTSFSSPSALNEDISVPPVVAETNIILEPSPVVDIDPITASDNHLADLASMGCHLNEQDEIVEGHKTVLPANYDPLGDSACTMEDPFADDDFTTPTTPPVLDNTPVQTEAPTMAAPPAPEVAAPVDGQQETPSVNVQQIQQIAEKVLRRIYHYVHTKCEFNTIGGYNNTNAILKPISIADIEGASELFAKQDTLNDMGVFSPREDVGNFIKGLPTADGIPRYTFYLNIGGHLHKRVFIAQNPTKTKGGVPTAWAQKAMNGGRIMMLLADGAGITAHVELENDQTLGQEKFVVWKKK